jgi:hypothetical protein
MFFYSVSFFEIRNSEKGNFADGPFVSVCESFYIV